MHPGPDNIHTPKIRGINALPVKHGLRDALPLMVLFCGSFAWFAFIADYVLFFQEKSSLFIFPELMTETMGKPGGFLISISEMLTSFYYYPAAGAFILSLIITLITFIISRSFLLISGKNEKIFPFVVGIMLFYLHTDYRFLLFNSAGILFQVIAVYFTARFRKNAFLPFLFLPALYFLTGAFTWIWLAATIILLLRAPGGNKVLVPGLLLLLAAVVVALSQYTFFINPSSLALYPLSFPEDQLHKMVFILTVVLITVFPLMAAARFPMTQFISIKYSTEAMVRSAVVALLLFLTGFAGYNSKDKHYFESEKMFYDGSFGKLIEYNKDYPSSNILTLFYNNIALAESGLLNDRMFSFPQSRNGETLFIKWEMIAEKLKRGGQLYYAVGMINEAHRWAFENMVMKGYTPEGLKMLARTELINGHYHMASKYISLLEKTFFYRKEAKTFRTCLFNDEALMKDPVLGEKRKMQVKSDFFALTDNPELNIERIFATDSLNKEAFEYKVAWMLINKDYKGIESVLPLFRKLGYKAFPTHVEEAIMMIALGNNDRIPDLGGLQVRGETVKRWEQFLSVFQQYGSNPRSAEPTLRKQFGSTFWYWAFYK